ncbi:hypothetical protein D9757_004787 [Collybiopsis confluens]|uniref:Uncharacterized protein n=1 Tax=Collybiopsis confluens TaxID=2823264 RepID=A0A8H5MCE0_9AGAR|nr:hypothetical protein D9757_004787 [Collybiopsis confluens]
MTGIVNVSLSSWVLSSWDISYKTVDVVGQPYCTTLSNWGTLAVQCLKAASSGVNTPQAGLLLHDFTYFSTHTSSKFSSSNTMRRSILPTLFMLAVFAHVVVGIPVFGKNVRRAPAPHYSISTFGNTKCTGEAIQRFDGNNGNDSEIARLRDPSKCVQFNQAFPHYCKVTVIFHNILWPERSNFQVIEGPLNPGHKVVLPGGATNLRIQCSLHAITTNTAVQLGAAGGAANARKPDGNNVPNFSRPLNRPGDGPSWI